MGGIRVCGIDAEHGFFQQGGFFIGGEGPRQDLNARCFSLLLLPIGTRHTNRNLRPCPGKRKGEGAAFRRTAENDKSHGR